MILICMPTIYLWIFIHSWATMLSLRSDSGFALMVGWKGILNQLRCLGTFYNR
ncbi:Uncharacterised protein [Vibrio cholerae]|nr:Uncharacterised protein [Vibrio cholerae]CSI86833.1 Uncharacterised protein [Vibrio cholerae]